MGGPGGGVHQDKPLRVGGVPGWWWWQRELPGRKWGVKMFELAQLNHFTPEVKKEGGASNWRCVGRRRHWGGWSLRGGHGCGRRRGGRS